MASGPRYSDEDYSARTSYRSTHDIPTFDHDAKIKSGTILAGVHKTLNPHGVKMRESRDSLGQCKIPIAVFLDTTGSMAKVPEIIQAALPKLMGGFLSDKASGKNYIGKDNYPDIMIGAVDDFVAQQRRLGSPDGCLQVGQFESGMEIDDNITNLWLTQNGGGTYEESYQLAMYFLAHHTVHDHWEKRHRKGYAFFIGDEHAYSKVLSSEVKTLIGDSLQDDITLAAIIKELKRRYHVFFIIPNMTDHYDDESLHQFWVGLLGQQNALKLDDPSKICEMIVSCVAICENHIGVDDLKKDGVANVSMSKELAPLASSALAHGDVSGGLPAISGTAGAITRL